MISMSISIYLFYSILFYSTFIVNPDPNPMDFVAHSVTGTHKYVEQQGLNSGTLPKIEIITHVNH
jgi:hypothetical protein